MSGFGAAAGLHDLGEARARLALMRHEIGGELRRPRHRRRQADGGEVRATWVRSRARSSASRSPRLLGDSACSSSRMTKRERAEQARGVGMRQHQRDLLGRGEQDVGRRQRAGAGAATGGVSPVRVSRRDGQAHLGDRRGEIAGDIDGKRLERRDIERVNAACSSLASASGEIDEARQEAGERLAAAGRARSAACRGRCRRRRKQRELMGVRAPAARGEPADKGLRQQARRRPAFQPLRPAHGPSSCLTLAIPSTNSPVA